MRTWYLVAAMALVVSGCTVGVCRDAGGRRCNPWTPMVWTSPPWADRLVEKLRGEETTAEYQERIKPKAEANGEGPR